MTGRVGVIDRYKISTDFLALSKVLMSYPNSYMFILEDFLSLIYYDGIMRLMADFGDFSFDDLISEAFEVFSLNSYGDLDFSLSSYIFFC
jgi:hypothetical protein